MSMMFALHYSFESEALARGMLANVAGALRKGGRFLGVMPDSYVISGMVKKLLGEEGKSSGAGMGMGEEGSGKQEVEQREEGEAEEEEDDWDPERPSEALPVPATAAAVNGNAAPSSAAAADEAGEDDEDDWDPEKPSEALPTTTPASVPAVQPNDTPAPNDAAPSDQTPSLPPLEWGNQIYTIRLPRSQPLTHKPLPPDGLFRPPYGWKYHYSLAEAVDAPEFVVPWEAFRALAEEYGLELLYRKNFREVLREEKGDVELGVLAERMGVLGRGGEVLVGEEELEAAGFYCGWCFYRV